MKNLILSRSTKECYFNEMHTGLIDEFNRLFSMKDFLGIESKIITCFEVTSLHRKLFGTRTIFTGIILTPEILFWGMSGFKRTSFASAALLKEIVEIRDYENTESYKIMSDTALEIFGFIYQASRRSSWHIGLGDDDYGKKCRRMLRELWDKKRT